MLLFLLACDPTADTATADTDTDTGTGADTDTDDDVDPTEGLLLIEGAASVVDRWEGTESLVLRGDLGAGAVDCQITYTVTSTGPASGCGDCMVQWEVVLGEPTVVVGDRCGDVGYDAATIAAIEGTSLRYGVALDYVGHANALLVEHGGRWEVEAFVHWSEQDGTVTYEWEQGYLTY